MSANVEIYTWKTCPYCLAAKALLRCRGVAYTEYRIDGDEQARHDMAARAEGRRTVPQIFINDQPIGGFDSLAGLQLKGRLSKLLANPVDSSAG